LSGHVHPSAFASRASSNMFFMLLRQQEKEHRDKISTVEARGHGR
jgi:hypothetical protein